MGNPSFCIRDKIFAMQHSVKGRASMWCKAPPGAQSVLVGSNPDQFFVPPYVGYRGWVGVMLDTDPDWDQIERIIHDGHSHVAGGKKR